MTPQATPRSVRMSLARRRQWRAGASVLELALVLMVLMTVAMGTVEYGQFFYMKQAFVAAARDGARQASLPGATQQAVVNAITADLLQANVGYQSGWVKCYDVPITGAAPFVVSDVATIPQGDGVQVQVLTTYGSVPNAVRPLSSITNGVGGISAGKVISSACTMVRE